MKKTLLTLLGIAALSGIGLSQVDLDSLNRANKKQILNNISSMRTFNMNLYDPYCVDMKAYKNKKCIISRYDTDENGVADILARFKFPGNGYQNALLVMVDENEDNNIKVYLSTNKRSVGFLNRDMPYEEYLEYLNLIKNSELGRDIRSLIPLRQLKPITQLTLN